MVWGYGRAWASGIAARVGALIIATALIVPVVVPAPLTPGSHILVPGLSIHRHPSGVDVVLVERYVAEDEAIGRIRRARVGRIELIVALSGSRQVGRLVSSITARNNVLDIWAPPGHQVPGARTVEDMAGVIGSLDVVVVTPSGSVQFSERAQGG